MSELKELNKAIEAARKKHQALRQVDLALENALDWMYQAGEKPSVYLVRAQNENYRAMREAAKRVREAEEAFYGSKEEHPKLDPTPYKHIDQETVSDSPGDNMIFNPSPEYSQDREDYKR